MPIGSNPDEGIYGILAPRYLGSRVKVFCEEEGNWRALTTQLDKLGPEIKKVAFGAMKAYGLLYVAALKRNIKTSGSHFRPPWAPLSPKYAKYKAKHGKGNAPIWYWHGEVFRSIAMHTQERTMSIKVGVDPNSGSRSSQRGGDLNTAQIAMLLESGSDSRGMASRPLFYPTWRLMGGNTAMGAFVRQQLSSKVGDHFLRIK
jgi:hypothetical protein